MKKIFTLIFSMGLLTAAFAQDGHRRDNNRDNGIVNQSYGHQTESRDRGASKSYGMTPFVKSNTWDSQLTRGNDSRDRKDFGFNNDRRDWSSADRNHEGRYQKEMRVKHSRRPHRSESGFQISFGFGR